MLTSVALCTSFQGRNWCALPSPPWLWVKTEFSSFPLFLWMISSVKQRKKYVHLHFFSNVTIISVYVCISVCVCMWECLCVCHVCIICVTACTYHDACVVDRLQPCGVCHLLPSFPMLWSSNPSCQTCAACVFMNILCIPRAGKTGTHHFLYDFLGLNSGPLAWRASCAISQSLLILFNMNYEFNNILLVYNKIATSTFSVAFPVRNFLLHPSGHMNTQNNDYIVKLSGTVVAVEFLWVPSGSYSWGRVCSPFSLPCCLAGIWTQWCRSLGVRDEGKTLRMTT